MGACNACGILRLHTRESATVYVRQWHVFWIDRAWPHERPYDQERDDGDECE